MSSKLAVSYFSLLMLFSANAHTAKIINLTIPKAEFFQSLQGKFVRSENEIAQMSGQMTWKQESETAQVFDFVVQSITGKSVLWLRDKENIYHFIFDQKSTRAQFKSLRATFWLPLPTPPEETLEAFVWQTLASFFIQKFDLSRFEESDFHFTRALISLNQHLILSPKTSDFNFEKIEFRINAQNKVDTFWAYSKNRAQSLILSFNKFETKPLNPDFSSEKLIPTF